MFTNEQIQELLQIVEKYHLSFIAHNLGTDILTTQDKELLLKHGIDTTKLSKTGKLEELFRFGVIADALGDEKTKNLTFEQFKEFVAKGHFAPLTQIEQSALETIKKQAYSDIKNLGNKVSQDLTNIILEAGRTMPKETAKDKVNKTIKEQAEIAVRERKTVKQLASSLGRKTEDWATDFERVADFILHNAYDTGKAENIKSEYGSDALVYKIPLDFACKHCVRLALTNGIGSKPIVFKLSEIEANGTNIGRKPQDWKLVIGGNHPYCRCTLKHVPPYMAWDEDKKSFSKPVPHERKSKGHIRVFMGGKELHSQIVEKSIDINIEKGRKPANIGEIRNFNNE